MFSLSGRRIVWNFCSVIVEIPQKIGSVLRSPLNDAQYEISFRWWKNQTSDGCALEFGKIYWHIHVFLSVRLRCTTILVH